MSVVTRAENTRGSHIFVKGAPEIVRDLCDPKTIPANFSQVVHGLTRQGLRILACASRHDPRLTWHASQKLTREAAERDLCFLGLLLMENRLKKETTGVIKSLRGAQIGCCMVTGDHVLTGITVSRLCGLVDPKSMLFLGEFAQDEDELPEKQRRKSWGGDSDLDEEIEQAADEGYAENRPRVRRSGAYSANNSEQDLLKLCETANQAESSGGVDIEGTQQSKTRRIVFRSLDEDDGRNFSCREMVSKMSMEGCAHWEIGITGPVFSALIRSAKLNPELEGEVHSLFARCKVNPQSWALNPEPEGGVHSLFERCKINPHHFNSAKPEILELESADFLCALTPSAKTPRCGPCTLNPKSSILTKKLESAGVCTHVT